MANYLMQISYTEAAWAALVRRPQNRIEAVRKVVRNLGGRIEGFWFAFGAHDLVGVVEMPDNVSAAAFSIAIAAGGACKSVVTTPLLSVADGIKAMRKAGTCGYKPVGQA